MTRIATLKPLTDDDAIYAPMPRRLGHHDPYLEPVRSPFHGILLGVLLGAVGWATLFLILYLIEVSS